MSTISGVITPSDRKNGALYVGGTWTTEYSTSHVIGNEASGSYPPGENSNYRRWRVERYTFTVPDKITVNGVVQPVISANLASINFSPKAGSAYVMYGGTQSEKGAMKSVSFVIQSSGSLTIAQKDSSKIITNAVDNRTSISIPGTDLPSALTPGTYYLFIIGNKGSGTSADYGWRYWVSEKDVTQINVEYTTTTACGVPTNITLNDTSGQVIQVAPATGQKATFSWTAGTAGNNNQVSGYRIFQKYGSRPTLSSYDNIISCGTSTTYTHTFDLSSYKDKRGGYIYFAVQTIGSAGAEYYSPLNDVYSCLSINTLPYNLSVTCSTTTLPYAGTGQIKITGLSASDITHSSLTYYYTTTTSFNENNKINLNQTISLNPNANSQILYFWAYDGLEPSAYKAITFTRNIDPQGDISISNTGLGSINNNSGYSYVPVPSITVKVNNAKNSTLKLQIQYQIDNGSWSTPTLLTTINNFNSKSVTTSIDIRDTLFLNNTIKQKGCKYKIRFLRTFQENGYEIDTYTSEYSSIYYLTKIPSLQGIYNKDQNENISGLENYFSNNLYFVFDYDAGYPQPKIKAKKVGYDQTVTFSGLNAQSNTEKTKMWINGGDLTTFKTNLNRGDSYEFLAVFTAGNSDYEATLTQQKTRIKDISSVFSSYGKFSTGIGTTENSPIENGGPLKPFTEHSSTQDTIMTVGFPYDNKELYGFATETSGQFKFSSKVGNTVVTGELSLGNSGRSGNNRYLKLSRGVLAKSILDNSPSSVSRNRSHLATPMLQIKNDFGDTTTISGAQYMINFKEAPTVSELILKTKNKGGNFFNLTARGDDAIFLMEGMEFYCSSSITSYNSNPKGQLQINRLIYNENGTQEEKGWQSYGGQFAFDPIEGTNEYKVENRSLLTIGQLIEKGYRAKFRIVVTTDAGYSSTYNWSGGSLIDCRGIQSGKVILENATLKDKALTLDYTIEDLGAYRQKDETGPVWYEPDPLTVYRKVEYIQDGTGSSTTVTLSKSTDPTDSGDYEDTANNVEIKGAYIAVRIKLDVSLYERTTGNKVTYTTYSNTIPIYGAQPTVAYRQNAVGINSKNMEEDAVLTVSSTTGKNYIVLKGTDGQNNHTITINLNTGDITGIIINGGTWS